VVKREKRLLFPFVRLRRRCLHANRNRQVV